MIPRQTRVQFATQPADLRKSFGAPGKAWCFQRVKFPRQQEVEPPHWEPSLGLMEATR